MDFEHFKEVNFTFNAQPSMEEVIDLPCFKGQASDLLAFVGKDSEEIPVIITRWRITEDELREFVRTGCIYLTILGTGMPPIYLGAENPFKPPQDGGSCYVSDCIHDHERRPRRGDHPPDAHR